MKNGLISFIFLIVILSFIPLVLAGTTINDIEVTTTGNVTASFYGNSTNWYTVADFLEDTGGIDTWNLNKTLYYTKTEVDNNLSNYYTQTEVNTNIIDNTTATNNNINLNSTADRIYANVNILSNASSGTDSWSTNYTDYWNATQIVNVINGNVSALYAVIYNDLSLNITASQVVTNNNINLNLTAAKSYSDTNDSLYLPLTGGTLSGNLTLINLTASRICNATNCYTMGDFLSSGSSYNITYANYVIANISNRSYYWNNLSSSTDIVIGSLTPSNLDLTSYSLTVTYLNGSSGVLNMKTSPWILEGVNLELERDLIVGGGIFPNVTLKRDIGSGALRWNVLWVSNISSENIDNSGYIQSNSYCNASGTCRDLSGWGSGVDMSLYYLRTVIDDNFSLYYPKTSIDNNFTLYYLKTEVDNNFTIYTPLTSLYSNLTDYVLVNGSRAMTGDLNLNGFNITNVHNISSNYYCNATNCYTLNQFLTTTSSDDTWNLNKTYYYNKSEVNTIINGNLTTAETYANTNINSNTTVINNDINLNLTEAKNYSNININSNITTTNNNINLNSTADRVYANVNIVGNASTYVTNNTGLYILNFSEIYSNDWSNVSINIAQLIDLVNIYNDINLNSTADRVYANVNINSNLTEAKNYTDTKLITTYYNASTIQVITGTAQGSIGDLRSYNGVSYNLSEVDSDISLIINFTGITDFNQLIVRYKSSSEESHNAAIQIWSYQTSTWEDYRTIGNTENVYNIFTMFVYDASNHISGGVVSVRFFSDNGAPLKTHKHQFDWIAISDGPATPSSDETDPFAIHSDGFVSFSANWDQGAFNLTNTDSWFLGKVNYSSIQNHPATSNTDSWSTNYTDYWNATQIVNAINSNVTAVYNNLNLNITASEVVSNNNINLNSTADRVYSNVNINSNTTATNNNINLNSTADRVYANVNIVGNASGFVTNNTGLYILNFSEIYSNDWSNVSINIAQLIDLVNIYNDINLNSTADRIYANVNINSNATAIANDINLNSTADRIYANVNIVGNSSGTDTWNLNKTYYYNKSEVDNNLSLYLLLTGGTMSGTLDMSAGVIDNVETLNTQFISAANFTGEIKMENNNITYVDCIVFNNGGKICSSG